MPVGHGERGVGVVRGPSREHLVEQDARGVDVGAGIPGAAGDQLGREVGHGAEQQSGGGGERRRLDGPRQAEIGDFDLPARSRTVQIAHRPGARRRQPEQHVLRLDVAVDHADAVRRGERPQDRLQDVDGLGDRQRPLLAEPLPQRRPLDQLHHQEHPVACRAPVDALVGDGDGVGRGQLRRRLGLPVEPGDEQRVPGERRVHDLHCDRAVESPVDRRVHRGHAACGEPVANLIAAVEDDPDHGIGDRRVHDRSVRSASRRCRPRDPPPCSSRTIRHLVLFGQGERRVCVFGARRGRAARPQTGGEPSGGTASSGFVGQPKPLTGRSHRRHLRAILCARGPEGAPMPTDATAEGLRIGACPDHPALTASTGSTSVGRTGTRREPR